MSKRKLNLTHDIREEVATLKRERTIDAAMELFYERGYANTTLDAVAERLGVTKPFIYAQFASKADILAEVCSRGIASSLQALDSVLSLKASPVDQLRMLGHDFVVAVLKSQKHIAIFTREEKSLNPGDYDRINGMRREFDAKLKALLEKGIASGDFRIPDAHIAALSIGGMVSWAYVWYRSQGRLTLDQVAWEMSSLILRIAGVGTGGTSSAPADQLGRSKTKLPRR